jgi:hypothetical protein
VGSVVIGGGVCKLGRDDLRSWNPKENCSVTGMQRTGHPPQLRARQAGRTGGPAPTFGGRQSIIRLSQWVHPIVTNPQELWAIGIPLQDCSLPEAGGGCRDSR